MLGFFTQGASLGFTAGTSPGPLQTFLIQSTLAHGWRRALICILSPLISDIPFILLTVFILNQFPPEVIRIVQIIGGVFMLYLAWLTIKGLRAGATIGGNDAGEIGGRVSLATLLGRTVLINWTSPGPYIFWGTVNGPLLSEALRLSLWHGVGFMAGFYGAFLILLAGWIVVFDRLRHIDPRVTAGLLWLTVLVLVGLGLSLLARGVGLIA
ncbi:MAG: LysE family transporter [Anaerolineae bacterium]|nr:LysE family transporter [Anaerolineae bacterium]NUQ04620.1 LysE family transporter [Anaerolineae bacterium]